MSTLQPMQVSMHKHEPICLWISCNAFYSHREKFALQVIFFTSAISRSELSICVAIQWLQLFRPRAFISRVNVIAIFHSSLILIHLDHMHSDKFKLLCIYFMFNFFIFFLYANVHARVTCISSLCLVVCISRHRRTVHPKSINIDLNRFNVESKWLSIRPLIEFNVFVLEATCPP